MGDAPASLQGGVGLGLQRIRWWESAGTTLFNGVFQGGGAKGIAYAGALRAFKDAGYWFGAAAGSSAGALTATLVAAGLPPEEMLERTQEGLASMHQPRWMKRAQGHVAAVFGARTAIYPTDGLRTWLEAVLRDSVEGFTGTAWGERAKEPGQVHDDVSFEDLFVATGIDLFIVGLDVSSRVPVVLSRYSAPRCQVSWAAVASSSIPVLMNKQQLVIPDEANSWKVVEIVDGGGWANYPKFVFADSSFVSSHQIAASTRNRKAVGFVLTPQLSQTLQPGRQAHYFAKPSEIRHRFGSAVARSARAGDADDHADDDPQQTREVWKPLLPLFAAMGTPFFEFFPLPRNADYAVWTATAIFLLAFLVIHRRGIGRMLIGLVSFVFTFGVTRVPALLALTGWVSAGAFLLVAAYAVGFAEYAADPETEGLGFAVFGLIGIALVGIACAATIALLVLLRFNSFLAHDAIATFDASLGAATRVPNWLGYDTSAEFVLRVPVVPRLQTTEFKLPTAKIERVVAAARESVAAQIADRKAGRTTPPPPRVLPTAPTELVNPDAVEAEKEIAAAGRGLAELYFFWPAVFRALTETKSERTEADAAPGESTDSQTPD